MNPSMERRASREPALSEVEGSSVVVAGRGRPALHSLLEYAPGSGVVAAF